MFRRLRRLFPWLPKDAADAPPPDRSTPAHGVARVPGTRVDLSAEVQFRLVSAGPPTRGPNPIEVAYKLARVRGLSVSEIPGREDGDRVWSVRGPVPALDKYVRSVVLSELPLQLVLPGSNLWVPCLN